MKLFALTALCFPLTQLCKCVTIDKYVSVWVKYSCQGRRSENCILYHLCCRQTNTQVHSLQSKVGFHRRISSIEGCFPLSALLHCRVYTIKEYSQSKVIIHGMFTFYKCHFLAKVIFNRILFSFKCHPILNDIVLRRLSSIKCCLPSQSKRVLEKFTRAFSSCGYFQK